MTVMYNAIFIVNDSVQAHTVDELANYLDASSSATFGLLPSTSNSGYRIPLIAFSYLRTTPFSQWRLRDFKNHTELISMVDAGRISGACVASDVWERTKNDFAHARVISWSNGSGRLPTDVYELLTGRFPSVTLGWRGDLPSLLQKELETAFITYPGWKDTQWLHRLYPERNIVGVARIENFADDWRPLFKVRQLFHDRQDNGNFPG